MTLFVSSMTAALFSFIGAKALNSGILTYQKCTRDDNTPIFTRNQLSRSETTTPPTPTFTDCIHFFCDTSTDLDVTLQQEPLSCSQKVEALFSRYMKQIGYTLTTVGGAALGAVLSLSKNADDDSLNTAPSFTGVYLSCIAMLLGTAAVIQANICYRCNKEELPQRKISHTYGSFIPSTPITLSPESVRTLTIHT